MRHILIFTVAAANEQASGFCKRNDGIHEFICLFDTNQPLPILLKAEAEVPSNLQSFAGHALRSKNEA